MLKIFTIFLFCWVITGCSDDNPSDEKIKNALQKFKENLKKENEKKKREREELKKKYTVSLGESIRVGNIEFTSLDISLRKIDLLYEIMGEVDKRRSEEKYLVMKCRCKNISEGQVFNPYVDTQNTKDNFMNTMRDIDFGMYNPEGYKDPEIKPGESFETVLVCEAPKIDKATDFIWGLDFDIDNQNNRCEPGVYVKFSKTEITVE